MKKEFYLLLSASLLFVMLATAQAPSKKYELYHGQQGITRKLSTLRTSTNAGRLSEPQPQPTSVTPLRFRFDEFKKFKKSIQLKNYKDLILNGEEDKNQSDVEENAMRTMIEPSIMKQNVWSNFLAISFTENPIATPPDPSGAIGTSQIAVLSNIGLKVFEKTSVTNSPLVTTRSKSTRPASSSFFMTLEEFFSPVMTQGSSVGDPHIRFDRLTKRWFVVAADFSNNNILLAVSDGDRIADASNFIYYSFPSLLFPYNPNTKYPPFFDYPTLGVDKNAVLIGGTVFFTHINDCNEIGDSVYFVGYAIDKKSLIHGQLGLYALQLGGLDFNKQVGGGIITPQGVQNDDPATNKSFFAGIGINQDAIVLAELSYDKDGQLTNLSETNVSVQPFQFPRDITAPGSPVPIDPVDNRLFAAAIHKNKLTGKSSLWTAHAVAVNQWGDYVPDKVYVQQARTGSRWYEIGNIYNKPQVSQLGTVYDPLHITGRRSVMYFNPSIMASGQGHAVLGGTTAAFNQYLNTFITGRYNGDASGTLGAPQKVTNTDALYALVYGNYFGRWGDFSQTDVDPLDDQTLWTFQEYANADDSYGVRAVQVKAPPPATPEPLGLLSNNADTVITLKGASVDGSGFFDPGSDKGGPGYNRLSVKSTGDILVSQIKFISPTEIRFKLNTKNKPAGIYPLVITNPDGQIAVTYFIIIPQWLNNALTQTANSELARKFVTSITAYPNPAQNECKVVINAAQDMGAKMVLMDITGKQLVENQYNLSKGTNEVPLSLMSYDKGTYLVAVYNQNHILVGMQKIVKQ